MSKLETPQQQIYDKIDRVMTGVPSDSLSDEEWQELFGVSLEDNAILKKQEPQTLKLWWAMMEMGEWPDEIPNPEPSDCCRFRVVVGPGAHLIKQGSSRRGRIQRWISDRYGFDPCLDVWEKKREERSKTR